MNSDLTSFFNSDLNDVMHRPENITYDGLAKQVLSNKVVVAYILQELTEEFSSYSIEEIKAMLESGVTAEKIKCSDIEDTHTGMLPIRFDVNTKIALSPLIAVEVDIEPQRKLSPGYNIYKRGIYYICRMISRQLDAGDRIAYDKLHKCYSIWICFQEDMNSHISITKHRFTCTDFLDESQPSERFSRRSIEQSTDLMELIYVYVPKKVTPKSTDLQRMLYAIFRKRIELIQPALTAEEYQAISKEVLSMGELEREIREEGRIEGREEGRIEGREEGRIEGRIEGREKGREEGREEGRERGREEGREEERARLIEKLRAKGMSEKEIAEFFDDSQV